MADGAGEVGLGIVAWCRTPIVVFFADGPAVRGMRGARTEGAAVDAVSSFRGVCGLRRRRSWGCEFEDVDGVACGADAEEGACGVEGHAVDAGRHAAAAELVEFFGGGDGEDTDYGSFVGGGGEESAGVVEGDAGEGGAVGFSDVDGF